MNKKRKIVAYIVIIFVSIVLFILFLLFFGKNEQYDYIPYILGSFSTMAIYIIKNSDKKPKEWITNQSQEQSENYSLIDKDDTSNDSKN